MNKRLAIIALCSAAAVVAGCATGPKYAEIAKTITPPKTGEGRIYFFRSNSMVGAAIQPEIRLNDVVVGKSIPGGFFYVDRPAGSYVGATSTETEKTLSLALAAGETKFVRSAPSIGILVGRINLTLEDPQKAQAEIETLSFVGAAGAATK